jgi:DNA adenine methylase
MTDMNHLESDWNHQHTEEPTPREPVSPLLKWVGGKSALLPQILKHVPKTFGTYYEPFAGSAALFFHLQPERAVLADKNGNLIQCYQAVVLETERVIRRLRWMERRHAASKPDPTWGWNYKGHFYYQTRKQWNICTAFQGGRFKLETWSPVQKAAAFLYLNRTCFNGVWRENRMGEFNVPMGRYKNPTICDPPRIRAAAAALERAELVMGDWRATFARAQPGDLVYLDPPYVPKSATANFTSYTAGGFGDKDQDELAAWTREAIDRGVNVLVSNSSTPRVRELYKGLPQVRIRAARSINSNAKRRGKVNEILVVGCRA